MPRMKLGFSKTLQVTNPNKIGDYSVETFSASEADSWDEARKEVEKAIYERKLELQAEQEKHDAEMRKKFPPYGIAAGQIGASQVAKSTLNPPPTTVGIDPALPGAERTVKTPPIDPKKAPPIPPPATGSSAQPTP